MTRNRLTTTYLDRNVISNLARRMKSPDVERVRRHLCSYLSSRVIILGDTLFMEMAFMKGDAHFKEELRLLESLRYTGFSRFESIEQMTRLEINAFRGIPFSRYVELYGMNLHFDKVELRAALEDRRARFQAHEVAARQRVEEMPETPEQRRRMLSKEWESDSPGILERWVRDRLRMDRELYGLPEDEDLWPTMAQLPTLRLTWGYLITRDVLTELHNSRKLHTGDFADWRHVQNAAHVDEFVTDDERFRDILTKCPGAKPLVLSTEAWIQVVLEQ